MEQNFTQPFKMVLLMRWHSNKNSIYPTVNMFMGVLSCQYGFLLGTSETPFFLSGSQNISQISSVRRWSSCRARAAGTTGESKDKN